MAISYFVIRQKTAQDWNLLPFTTRQIDDENTKKTIQVESILFPSKQFDHGKIQSKIFIMEYTWAAANKILICFNPILLII